MEETTRAPGSSGVITVHNLRHEEERLRAGGQGTHPARTLIKEHDLRVVLLTMERGARIDEHRAPATITIHVLAGHLRLHTGDQTTDLPAGQLVSLGRHVVHAVEALQESSFLLTIGAPASSASPPAAAGDV